MRPPLVDSTFDVANWFLDNALNEGEYLQPGKMHRLMFLAQAYYAVANNGQLLMPAVFVAEDQGPVEPNVYRAFENERPWISMVKMPEKATHFLDSIWRRFGQHSAGHLTNVIRKHPPYADAYKDEPRCVITLDSMVAFYGSIRPEKAPGGAEDKDGAARKAARVLDAAPVESVVRPRVMRSHTGRPVNVMPWMPKKGKPG